MKTLFEIASELLIELRKRVVTPQKCEWCHGTCERSIGNSEAADQEEEIRKCSHCTDGYGAPKITTEDSALIQGFEKSLEEHRPK